MTPVVSRTHPNHLRQLLAAGGVAHGLSCVLGDPQIAEEFGYAGFDYIYIDQQHGLTSPDVLVSMLRAIAGTTTTPLVRVACNDPALIGHALDAGAEGVIVPMVEDAEQAAAAVRACRYQPAGSRSWGPLRAAYGLGADPVAVNGEVLCLVMIESRRGLDHLEQIVATPGVDGVYIGPADLAVSLGGSPVSLRQLDEADELLAVIRRIRDACSVAGRVAAISGDASAPTSTGFRMLTVGSDIAFIREGLSRVSPSDSTREDRRAG